MYQIDKIQFLQIGVQGENDATNIEIDMTSWANQFPDAVFHILFKPYNASTPSPMLTTYADGVLTWTVGVGATAVVGVGYTEIRAQDASTGLIKKSRIIPTSVDNSVSGVETTPPASYQEWVTEVLNAGTDAKNSAAAAMAYSQGKQIKFEIGDDDDPDGMAGHLLFYFKDEEDEEWEDYIDLGPVDVYAMAVATGYTGTKAQWVQSMNDAESNAQKAEKYAVGKVNGTDVGSTDPTYHNNSKYYSEQAAGSATDANAAKVAAQAAQSAAETAAQTNLVEWLEENITNPDSPPLDRTLSSSSAATPADITGNLKSALANPLFETENFSITTGHYYKSDGTLGDSASWGYTNKIEVTGSIVYYKGFVQVGSGNPVTVFFDGNNNVVDYFVPAQSTTAWKTRVVPANAKYIGFSINIGDFDTVKYFITDVYKKFDAIEGDIDELNQNPAGTRLVPTYTSGHYYKADGSLGDSSAWKITNKFDIRGYNTIFYRGFVHVGTGTPVSLFLDASDNVLDYFIPETSLTAWKTKEIPNNAKYVAFSVSISDDNVQFFSSCVIHDEVDYHINLALSGKENECWSWWYYPQVISFKRVRNKVYWGYTTGDGYTGIAEYDIDNETYKKNNLIKLNEIDDHNACAIHISSTGTIMVVFSVGHNTSKEIRIYKSAMPESIEQFNDPVIIKSAGNVTYGQLIEYDGKIYLFYRSTIYSWAYRYTSDGGDTWSSEIVLVTASMQYYCRFMPTTTDGVVRICMYSNPDAGDTNIRQGFLHLSDGKVYNSDNETYLGTSNIASTSFTILIANETSKVQRMFDVAITAIDSPLILYAPFSAASNSVYKVYDAGTKTTICEGGTDLLSNKYQLGCAWIGTDKIVSIRGESGNDVVELYDYSSGQVTLSETVYTEARGDIPIRNARPIVDVNHKAYLWQRGYYNQSSFQSFNMDAVLKFFDT